MQGDSDPDDNLSESKGSDDDHETNIRKNSYPTDYDQDSSSYSSSGNISKDTNLIPKLDDRTSSGRDTFGETIKEQNTSFLFHCSFCYFQTPQKHYFKVHTKTCKLSNPKRYWGCPRCNVRYSSEDLLDGNSTEDPSTLGKRIFHCPVCLLEFKNKSEAPILDKVAPSNRHYACPHCKEKIEGANGLKRHLITQHDVTLLYKCEYCNFTSTESDNLLEHKKSHAALQEMGLIQCSHCHLDFFTMNEIKNHMKKVNFEKIGKDLQKVAKEKTKDFVEEQQTQKSKNLNKEKADDKAIDNLLRDTAKLQLHCTLCEYVNYSQASCHRHVKNKHRSSGHSMVKFKKYYQNEFKGTIEIGKKGGDDAEKSSTQDLLKILDWTHSDGEDIPEPEEKTVRKNVDTREVISIEMASDSEDENKIEENSEEIGTDNPISLDDVEASPKSNKSKGVTCKECSYQGKNKLHLSIHQQLMHHQDKTLYKCPQRFCAYTSIERVRFSSHLTRFHKVTLDLFYPADMKCWDCVYTAKKPHHLLLHRKHAHTSESAQNRRFKKVQKPKQHPQHHFKERKLLPDDQFQDRLRKNTKTGKPLLNIRAKQQHSQEKTSMRSLAHNIPSKPKDKGTETDRQAGVKYSQLRCKQCGVKHQEMYNLAWHMFKIHNNTSELRKWRLRCKECSYENYSKTECLQHGGAEHKIPLVRFQKYYMGKLKGAIGFRYKEHEISSGDTEKSKGPDNVKKQKDPLKLQDEVSKSEIVSTKVKEAAISDEETIVDKTKRVEKKLGNVENDDNDLFFAKKEEFFTCPRCNYETKHKSYISMHNMLVHKPQVSVGKTKYQCNDCTFQSKYRHSIRRHWNTMHNYKTEEFYTKEQAFLSTRKQKESKFVEELRISHECRLCVFTDQDKYMLDWHMSTAHGNKTVLLKWNIHCSLCDFQSSLKSAARVHALTKHSDLTTSKTVKFVKYYEDKFYGYFDCKLENDKVHYCSKCDYSASTLNILRRHLKYCSGSNQEQKSIMGKREKTDSGSAIGEKYEVIEGLEGTENNTEEGEGIQSRPRGSDDEINENEDSSESEEEYLHYESLLDEDLNISKRAEQEKSDDDVNDDANLPENDEEFKEYEKDRRSKTSTKRHRSADKMPSSDNENNDSRNDAEDSNNLRTSKRKRSVGPRQVSSQSDEDSNSKDGDENSDSNSKNLKKDQKNTSTSQKSDLPAGVSPITNKCINELCSYASTCKSHLKRHCLKVHRYGKKKLDEIFSNIDRYKCDLCTFQSSSLKSMNVHINAEHKNNTTSKEERNSIPCPKCKYFFRDQYKLANHMVAAHGDNSELLKWTIRCTLCNYENRLTKYANRHGKKHTSTTEPIVVKFEKFYEDTYKGSISFEYGIRVLHRCSTCDYVAGTWECLKKHLKRHKKKKSVPLYRFGKKWAIDETNSTGAIENCKFKSPVCPRKDLMSDKYEWANHMFEVHGDVSEIMKCFLKCPLCSYETHYTKYAYQHGKAHSSTTGPTTLKFQKKYQDKKEGFYICRYGMAKLNRCNLCDFVTTRKESLRTHFRRHKNKTTRFRNKYLVKKADVVEEAEEEMQADSDEDETKINSDDDSGTYSKQQIMDIIGLANKPNNKRTSAIIEDSIGKDENSKLSEHNEVITIEITTDDHTGTEDEDNVTTKTTLNPFSGEYIVEEEFLNYKCSQIHCNYISDNLEKITDHIKQCARGTPLKNKIVKKFTCLLCKQDLNSRSYLQTHTNVHAADLDNPNLTVTFSEFTNDEFTCGIELTANNEGITNSLVPRKIGNISYKCLMCGSVIVTRKTLPRHTYLHARKDGKVEKLQVRYSKFVDDQLEGVIIMHADPNYLSKIRKPIKSPEPEYDPSLPVLSCKECNFKTNVEAALKKHKNLHWTAEKDALYKAQKWFNCSVCSFQCYNVETFKKHSEFHKKH